MTVVCGETVYLIMKYLEYEYCIYIWMLYLHMNVVVIYECWIYITPVTQAYLGHPKALGPKVDIHRGPQVGPWELFPGDQVTHPCHKQVSRPCHEERSAPRSPGHLQMVRLYLEVSPRSSGHSQMVRLYLEVSPRSPGHSQMVRL